MKKWLKAAQFLASLILGNTKQTARLILNACIDHYIVLPTVDLIFAEGYNRIIVMNLTALFTMENKCEVLISLVHRSGIQPALHKTINTAG